MNLFFGSGILTTPGIIMNDEMDDFSSADRSNAFGFPPSKANFIAPGKRPLSTMTPTIVESPTGQLEVVVGGSGGSRIVVRTFWLMFVFFCLVFSIGWLADWSGAGAAAASGGRRKRG